MNFKRIVFLLTVALAPLACNGDGNIIEIQIKTGDDLDAATDGIQASVDVSIINIEGLGCNAFDLESDERDFQRDDVNVFWGGDIDSCDGFFIPGGTIPILTLSHDGRDDWTPEWVRVVLDDSTFLMCYDGQEFDGEDSHNLICNPDLGGHVVDEIQIKTADEDGAGFGAGSVDVDLQIDLSICSISDIRSSGSNWERNVVDTFLGSDIESCLNFPVPDGVYPIATISHEGFDDWEPEWVRVLMADSTFVMCYAPGGELENDEFFTLPCAPYPKTR